MNDMPVTPNEKEKPTCRICISKDDASKMKVGSDIRVEVSGQVKSLHPSYDDKSMYEVEIEDPKCDVESSEDESKEDSNMATMPRKKLKEKIMPQDEE
jgi:hypothetical protein